MAVQAKSSSTQILLDFETTYKNPPAEESRKPKSIPFNSIGLRRSRPILASTTLTGNRNPVQGTRGNISVDGPMVVPLDHISSGYWLKALLGNVSTVEALGSDLKNAANITTSGGVATISAAQPATVIAGAKITYNTTQTCYVSQVNSTTEFVVVDQYWRNTIADEGPLAIDSIKIPTYTHSFSIHQTNSLPSLMLEKSHPDLDIPKFEKFTGIKVQSFSVGMDANGDEILCNLDLLGSQKTPSSDIGAGGTVTIASGDTDFSVAQTGIAVGDIIYYGTSGSVSKAYVTAVADTSNVTVKSTRGGSTDVSDVTAVTLQGVVQSGDYAGHLTDAVRTIPLTRFELSEISVEEGGVSSELFRSATIDIGNNLDGTSYVLGGGNIRRNIPEGVASIGGNVSVIYEDNTMLDKSENSTESSMIITITNATNSNREIKFQFDELNYGENSPTVSGSGGISLDLDFQAYYANGANSTAILVTLKNGEPQYAL